MLVRRYVIRELSKEGHLIRPIANNWSEGAPGYFIWGDDYSDMEFETQKAAEHAIYDFFWGIWKKDKGPLYATPRYTVIEVLGFEGE